MLPLSIEFNRFIGAGVGRGSLVPDGSTEKLTTQD